MRQFLNGIAVPSGVTSLRSLNYTWPASLANGAVLSTDSSGVLSWTTSPVFTSVSGTGNASFNGTIKAGTLGAQGTFAAYSNSASGTGAFGTIFADNTRLGRLVLQAGQGSAATVTEVAILGHLVPTVDNNTQVGTASFRWNSLYVGTGASFVGGNFNINYSTDQGNPLSVNGASLLHGAVTIDGVTNITGNLNVAGAINSQGVTAQLSFAEIAGTSNIWHLSGTSAAAILQRNASTLFTITSAGNVTLGGGLTVVGITASDTLTDTSYIYAHYGATQETRLGDIFGDGGLYRATGHMRFDVAGSTKQFYFSQGSSVRLQIDANTGNIYNPSGKIGIGVNDGYFLDLFKDVNATALGNTWAARIHNTSNVVGFGLLLGAGNASGGTLVGFFTGAGAGVGQITHNGTTTTYGTTSDARLKRNIHDTAVGLPLLRQIRVRDFEFIAAPVKQTGFIAQELYSICPEAVHKPVQSSEQWSVDYGRLTPYIVAGVQELDRTVVALTARVKELENQLGKLDRS